MEDKMADKLRKKTGDKLGNKPQNTDTASGRQDGNQDQTQEKDKPSEADTEFQTRRNPNSKQFGKKSCRRALPIHGGPRPTHTIQRISKDGKDKTAKRKNTNRNHKMTKQIHHTTAAPHHHDCVWGRHQDLDLVPGHAKFQRACPSESHKKGEKKELDPKWVPERTKHSGRKI